MFDASSANHCIQTSILISFIENIFFRETNFFRKTEIKYLKRAYLPCSYYYCIFFQIIRNLLFQTSRYENDDTQDVTQDNAMFTDILNSCCIEKNNLLYDLDNTIIYKSNDDDEEDTGLDLYPVKEDDNKIRGNNYSEMLYFESINLQPVAQKYQIPSETKTPTTTLQLKDIGCSSTAVAQRTKYLPRQNTNLYNLTMPFPPSNPLKTAQYNQIKLAANANLENNSFSDTDSSIAQKGGPCCFVIYEN